MSDEYIDIYANIMLNDVGGKEMEGAEDSVGRIEGESGENALADSKGNEDTNTLFFTDSVYKSHGCNSGKTDVQKCDTETASVDQNHSDTQYDPMVVVCISEMTWWTTDSDVEAISYDLGIQPPKSIVFADQKSNGKSKGTAHVEYEDPDSALSVKQYLENCPLNGKKVESTLLPLSKLYKFQNIVQDKLGKSSKNGGLLQGGSNQQYSTAKSWNGQNSLKHMNFQVLNVSSPSLQNTVPPLNKDTKISDGGISTNDYIVEKRNERDDEKGDVKRRSDREKEERGGSSRKYDSDGGKRSSEYSLHSKARRRHGNKDKNHSVKYSGSRKGSDRDKYSSHKRKRSESPYHTGGKKYRTK